MGEGGESCVCGARVCANLSALVRVRGCQSEYALFRSGWHSAVYPLVS